MNLDNLHTQYKSFEELFETEKQKYEDLFKRDQPKETLERLGRFEFTPEEKEIIAKTNYAIGEINKLKQTAIFADYFGIDFENKDKFEQVKDYNVLLSNLKNPLVIFDENNDLKITNEKEWKEWKETQVELMKRHFTYIGDKIED